MEQMSPLLQARIEQQKALNDSNKNNNTQYVDLAQKPDTFELSNKQEKKESKGNIGKILAFTAAIAGAAGLGLAIYKGKGSNLSNIKFDKGIALVQNGDKFTGKIKDKVANADGSYDKIVMEYVDGVLQKSTRSGKVNFEKVYETVNNEKIVKKTVNGVTTEFNITKTQQEVKEAQEKLKGTLNPKAGEAVEEAAQVTPKTEETVSKAGEAVEEVEEKTENKVPQKTAEATSEATQKALPEAEKPAETASETTQKTTPEAEKAAGTDADAKLEAEEAPQSKVDEKTCETAEKTTEVEKKSSDNTEKINTDLKLIEDARIRAAQNQAAQDFVTQNMDELDKVLLDKDGKILMDFRDYEHNLTWQDRVSLNELIKPLDKDLGEIYHATNPSAKSSILKEGFKEFAPSRNLQHDHATGGIYFARNMDEVHRYGDSIVKARFNGKVGVADTECIDSIKKLTVNTTKVGNLLKSAGRSELSPDLIIKHYIRQKIINLGYSGILCNGHSTALCKQFIALKPELIEILG